MKKAIAIFAAAILLASCGQESINEISETAPISETTLAETAQTTETTVPETAPEVTSITEASEPEEDTKNIVRTIDLDAIKGNDKWKLNVYMRFFGGDKLCIFTYGNEDSEILTLDIGSGETETVFSDSFKSSNCYSRTLSDGRLYAEFSNSSSLETLYVLINKDGSYESEISEYGKGYWDYDTNEPVQVGEHLVKSTFEDGIFDAESGEILVPNELAEAGHMTESYELACVLDDNRFVYQKERLYWDGSFYEGKTDGIGIYSFDTKTAEDIPEALDAYYSTANGKIYTTSPYHGQSDWDEFLSATDINTLETDKLLTRYSHEGIQTYFRITAPDDCEFIGAQANYKSKKRGYEGFEYVLIDPISGEIIRTLPEEFVRSNAVNDVFYTENYICSRVTFKGDMLYIVEK